jgi:4-diphosphocytidyl-2-C-methyl-D-erythritol kinase
MIMQRVEIYDLINIDKIKNGIILECNRHYIPLDGRNIVYKAAKLFLEEFNINSGVKINIEKNIPVAAGMAGGSADAATTLIIMKELFNIDVSLEKLKELALKLGADVPYCIEGGTALCEGIGEKITYLKPFKDKIVVVVKPPFGVSTKDVYAMLDVNKIFVHPNTNLLIKSIEEENLELVSKNMKNVLENVTLRKHRCIKELKEGMLRMGALGALMSGSGPTVFGVFDDMLKAQRCYDKIKRSYREVFITRTI